MTRLALLALLAPTPAFAEVSREECLQLLFRAESNRLDAEAAIMQMRQMVFDVADEIQDEDQFADALALLLPAPAEGVSTVWDTFGAALGEICRDKL